MTVSPKPLFSTLSTSVGRLRAIAAIEGVSYLLLLFVAMPLKYWAGVPQAVRVTGSIHGVLFVAFGVALFQTFAERKTNFGLSALVFVSSLVPFGTFLVDGRLRQCADAASTPPA